MKTKYKETITKYVMNEFVEGVFVLTVGGKLKLNHPELTMEEARELAKDYWDMRVMFVEEPC